MIKLKCPSCGGALELPDNLGAAHCMYCGAKILIEHTEATRELQDLRRSVELCKVALEARNYTETIEYCNRILEIDPSSVTAWIDKATATFWMTTGVYNRYDEAMEYLKNAAQIAPGDERISKAEEELTRQQAWWYNSLGNNTFEGASKVWDIYDHSMVLSKAQAVRASLALFNKTMDYYLLAARYAPEDITILENIERVTTVPGRWITWGDAVHTRLRYLGLLRAKKQAEVELPRLRAELQTAEADLA